MEGGEGAGIKKYNWEEENRQGDVKHSIEKGEFKELICTTHGHKLRGLLLEGRGVPGRGTKGKNWDSCNSIINKIYFKKIKRKKCPTPPLPSYLPPLYNVIL